MLMAAMSAGGFTSCDDDDDNVIVINDDPVLDIVASTGNKFDGEGGTLQILVNSNLDYTPPATGVAGGGTIDGSITLTFTEALYAYTSSSGGMPTRTPLDAAPITGRPQPSAYQSIGSYFPNTNPQISLALNQTVGTPLRSVRINFDGVSLRNPTTRITLDFSGQFSGASSDPQNNPLSITVRATDPANSSEVTVTVNDPDNWLAAPIE